MKALELDDKGGGEPLDAQSLHRVPLLGALLTEIRVVPLQQLSFHVLTRKEEKILTIFMRFSNFYNNNRTLQHFCNLYSMTGLLECSSEMQVRQNANKVSLCYLLTHG